MKNPTAKLCPAEFTTSCASCNVNTDQFGASTFHAVQLYVKNLQCDRRRYAIERFPRDAAASSEFGAVLLQQELWPAVIAHLIKTDPHHQGPVSLLYVAAFAGLSLLTPFSSRSSEQP